MMRRNIAVLLCAAMVLAAGCAGREAGSSAKPEAAQSEETADAAQDAQQAENEEPDAEAAQQEAAQDTAPDLQKYEGKDWTVTYDPALVGASEEGDAVTFTYTGESAGTNSIKIQYVSDRMPDEVLYDAMADEEGLPEHTRSEGYFAGRSDVWALRTSVTDEAGEKGTDYTAVEHNGGTLLITSDWQRQDDAVGTTVSDTMAQILDSFVFTSHDPQTWCDYVPGRYVQTLQEETEGETTEVEYYVELNADHTGTLSLQDEIPVIWYCREGRLLNADTYEQIGEYTIEGDTLYLADQGESLGEFTRQ